MYPMSNDNEKEKKERGELKPALLIILLVIVAALVVVSLDGRLGARLINRIRNAGPREIETESFYYSAGKNAVFADMSGGLAIASGSGLQVFDKSGSQTISETFMMNSPAVSTTDGHGVAYDIGGKELRLFDDTHVILPLTTDYPIISAEIGADGRLAVCTEDSGYKGRVTVYSSAGAEQYRWFSGEGYVLSAALPKSGNEMAVLTVTDAGSRIVFLRTDDAEYAESVELPGELVIDAAFTKKNTITAVSETALYRIKEGAEPVKTDFGGRYLSAYTIGENLTAAVLLDYRSGNTGQLTVFDDKGAVSDSCGVSGVIDFSGAGRYAAVLTDFGLSVYDDTLERIGDYRGVSGFTDVIMRSDGTVAAASENYAENFAGND